MVNIYHKHFLFVLLKIFWNFRNTSRFLHFPYNLFLTLMKFLNTSAKRKVHSIKLSGSSQQKVFFSIYWRNIQVWTLVYEVVCACGFEFLRTFLGIFVTSANEVVCEIVLIMRGSTEYFGSTHLFLLGNQSLMLSVYYYHGMLAYIHRQAREW